MAMTLEEHEHLLNRQAHELETKVAVATGDNKAPSIAVAKLAETAGRLRIRASELAAMRAMKEP